MSEIIYSRYSNNVWFNVMIIILTQSLALLPGGIRWHDLGSLQPRLPGSSNSPASASQVARITGTRNHAWLIFFFLIETRSHCVAQAGPKLLGSSNPPTPASQSAVTIGVIHHTQPHLYKFLSITYFLSNRVQLCCPGWSQTLGSTNPPALASGVAGTTGQLQENTTTPSFYPLVLNGCMDIPL